MGRDFAAAPAAQHIAPPLEADLSRDRLVNELAHAGDFQIERIKGKQRVPVLKGSKQAGEKAVLVGRAYEPLAMGKCILHRARWRSNEALSAFTRPRCSSELGSADARRCLFSRRLLGFHAGRPDAE